VSTPRVATRKKLETAGSGSASSPLPFPAGGENHRHLQKKKNASKVSVLPPSFRSALF